MMLGIKKINILIDSKRSGHKKKGEELKVLLPF